VVAYKLGFITAFLLRTLGMVKIQHFSQPNLLAGKELVPEFFQEAASAENLADALAHWLDHPDEVLQVLSEEGFVHAADGQWNWTHESYPADAVSLRAVTSDNYVIVDVTEGSRVIGETDYTSALSTLHEKAIYILEGALFQVERLDIEGRKAYVRSVECDYYTDAITYTKVNVLDVAETSLGEISDGYRVPVGACQRPVRDAGLTVLYSRRCSTIRLRPSRLIRVGGRRSRDKRRGRSHKGIKTPGKRTARKPRHKPTSLPDVSALFPCPSSLDVLQTCSLSLVP